MTKPGLEDPSPHLPASPPSCPRHSLTQWSQHLPEPRRTATTTSFTIFSAIAPSPSFLMLTRTRFLSLSSGILCMGRRYTPRMKTAIKFQRPQSPQDQVLSFKISHEQELSSHISPAPSGAPTSTSYFRGTPSGGSRWPSPPCLGAEVNFTGCSPSWKLMVPHSIWAPSKALEEVFAMCPHIKSAKLTYLHSFFLTM